MNQGSHDSPPSAPNPRRIIVRGSCGSGKTTMAGALSKKLDIEHTELDANFHLPNWQSRPRDEFQEIIDKVVERDRWIIDGNYQHTMTRHQSKADMIVWLDYSFLTIFIRLFRRTISRMITQEELWSGNRETFVKQFFTRDSIFWWMIKTYSRRRRQCVEQTAEMQGSKITLVHLKTPREADAWLSQLK